MENIMDDVDNIFNKRQSILIANVMVNGKAVDIFVNDGVPKFND